MLILNLFRKTKSRGDKIFYQFINFIAPFSNRQECSLCGWKGRYFLPYGIDVKYRTNALCPRCGSLERHRAVKLLTLDNLKDSQYETLHVAPEEQITQWLKSISKSYLSIDLFRPAMEKMDLTSLALPNSSKTLVFCSHVLEHIPDDIKAMEEIFRVLKPGGIAIIQVPIWREKTYEDFSITSKEERLKHFFQEDHVRLYGLDIVDRLQSVGFSVSTESVESLPVDQVKKYSLNFPSTKEVFICHKPNNNIVSKCT